MKKTQYFICFACVSILFVAGCKSGKDITAKVPAGETEVIVPCSGANYFTSETTFRANSIGESADQVLSKKKALTNARSQLAASIQATVKTVTDNYVNSREFNNREEVEERFESLNRELVNQELSGVKVICEKLTRTAEGRYKTYIAVELAADELMTAYAERLSTDERLRIDYDYEQFKETFDTEMRKLSER